MVGHSGKRRTAKRLETDDDEPTWMDELDQALDDLNVNRLSTREKALATLQSILSKRNASAVLISRTEEFVESLLRRIDLGESTEETALAIDLLVLAFVNHGDRVAPDEQEAIYQEAAQSLREKAKRSKDPFIKAKCYEAMGLLTYILSLEIDAQVIRQEMQSVFGAGNEGEDDEVLAAATLTYAMMFIVSFCQDIMDPSLVQEEIDRVLEEVTYLLEIPGPVKLAATQAAALMMETLQSTQGDIEHNQMNEVIHALRELSMESVEDEDEEELFESALSTIEDSISPLREYDIKGKTYTLESWGKIVKHKKSTHSQ
ncbi:hypothetical protein DM01DRAFT_108496 [Hesseltinella vesiculosa]|uniref:Interferon-related developmental regulator N-terminal domain-containing protein n=1 Tax=Hesseltinella vesiculosa TaxID=101127 RepID=A0A1X2GPA8_9FUNG|nr:hypothetical protein DM01DRAFT_108496 [Hesseltinella vesiculosa]